MEAQGLACTTPLCTHSLPAPLSLQTRRTTHIPAVRFASWRWRRSRSKRAAATCACTPGLAAEGGALAAALTRCTSASSAASSSCVVLLASRPHACARSQSYSACHVQERAEERWLKDTAGICPSSAHGARLISLHTAVIPCETVLNPDAHRAVRLRHSVRLTRRLLLGAGRAHRRVLRPHLLALRCQDAVKTLQHHCPCTEISRVHITTSRRTCTCSSGAWCLRAGRSTAQLMGTATRAATLLDRSPAHDGEQKPAARPTQDRQATHTRDMPRRPGAAIAPQGRTRRRRTR